MEMLSLYQKSTPNSSPYVTEITTKLNFIRIIQNALSCKNNGDPFLD
jgi:hypothetical protein